VHPEGNTALVPRTVWTEVTCARELLDKLEIELDTHGEEQIRFDVVIQLADELARLASTMKQRSEAERRPRQMYIAVTMGGRSKYVAR
jgi:hypothetical protein